MKYIFQLIALGAITLLSSCGDFYTFDETATPSGGISMTVAQDTAWLMVGDRMPLQVTFTPNDPDSLPVFWMAAGNGATDCATTLNDTVTALRAGEMDFVAVGVSGTQRDTCHIIVIDRWEERDFSHEQRSDMVVYADITVDGKPIDYDRDRRRLYRAADRPEFSALSALGTLSQLYQIIF